MLSLLQTLVNPRKEKNIIIQINTLKKSRDAKKWMGIHVNASAVKWKSSLGPPLSRTLWIFKRFYLAIVVNVSV